MQQVFNYTVEPDRLCPCATCPPDVDEAQGSLHYLCDDGIQWGAAFSSLLSAGQRLKSWLVRCRELGLDRPPCRARRPVAVLRLQPSKVLARAQVLIRRDVRAVAAAPVPPIEGHKPIGEQFTVRQLHPGHDHVHDCH